MNRKKVIIRTGVIGIFANVFLAGFKAVIGFISGSIAVTMDAVNNLSDALSSVITIVSTKLAGKAPDKKHPYGYGRIEYLSAVTISVIVLYAGITSLVESVKKIIQPEAPDYAPIALIIIGVAVAVKIVLGIYVHATGKKVKSDSLVASGKDALLDAVISTSTLVAAAVFIIWGISLEAWLAAIISLVIIKSGVEMLRDSVSSILGERVEGELSNQIREIILTYPEVSGVYDLILHNYGPENHIGSVHIELPENLSVRQLDILERDIYSKVYRETGVALTGISVYSRVTDNRFSNQVYSDLRDIISADERVLQLHGFLVDEQKRQIYFDIIIDFDANNRKQIFQDIVEKIQEKYPAYNICPTLDADASDF